MDRIVITIRPASSDEKLLSVADAMQQVLDTLKILSAADRSAPTTHDEFVWRLERASTSSPFTIVALADPVNPSVDVAPRVRAAKAAVADGIRGLVQRGESPVWLDDEGVRVVQNLLRRNQNGIGETDIDFDGDAISIGRPQAEAGLRALAARNIMDLETELSEREAFGEVEGVMVAAGRYRNRPAIQIRSEYYGFVWCVLPPPLVQRFGSEHAMADIWEGHTIAVQGRLYYASGGRLARVEIHDIREIQAAPPIDLDAVLDPEFTAGMDPHEYLRRLHDGDLA